MHVKPDETDGNSRATHIAAVIEDCLRRREAGDAVSDAEVTAAHVGLMPELGEELAMLALIGRARNRALGAEGEPRAPVPSAGTVGIGSEASRLLASQGYDIECELHRGGQGVVYRAVQQSTRRKVALKVLRDSAFAGPVDRARFAREVDILAALRHPNIVTIYDSGSAAGRFYFVMDFIAGPPLDVYMSSAPRSVRETLLLFSRICDAVNAAHLRGIIHRDLKPANIRVDKEGVPFILDFGLARVSSGVDLGAGGGSATMTQTGQFIGSLPWSAPEQASGSPARVDTRSDVYSLGVLLYQMLTGKFPYSVIGPMHEVVQRIVQEAPLPPRKLRREIDDDVSTIVLKCLSKEQERRYQTAGELGRDVDRYLRSEPIEAKRDSAWYMLRKSLRRFRLLLVGASLFVVLLAASSAVSWSLWQAAAEREAEARAILWESLLTQARSARHTNELGRRAGALEAIGLAAGIRQNLELRNEMIATLAITDAEPRALPITEEGMGIFDAALERSAVVSGDTSGVTVVRVSDGEILARVPSLPLGSELQRTSLDGPFLGRVFDTPAGSRRIEVWRLGDGGPFLEFNDVPPLGGFDIAEDDVTLAVAGPDKSIKIYDLQSGKMQKHIPLDRVPSRMKFDPSGRRLALYHGEYGRAAILDLASGTEESAFDAENIAWSVAWSPDGGLLFGGQANQIQIWDAEARQQVGMLSGHDSVITEIAVSPDGLRLLSRSWDDVSIMWDLSLRRPVFEGRGSFVRFSPDGAAIAGWMQVATGAGRVTRAAIMELTGGRECRTISCRGSHEILAHNEVKFIQDGSAVMYTIQADSPTDTCGICFADCQTAQQAGFRIGSCRFAALDHSGRSLSAFLDGRGLYRWPVSSNAGTLQLGQPEAVVHGESWPGAAWSADGRVVAFTDAPGKFTLLCVATPSEARQFACDPSGVVMTMSGDARLVVVTAWHERGAQVWDTRTGQRVANLPTSLRTYAAFSADDRRLVTGDSESLCVWDVATWNKSAEVIGSHADPIYARDGRTIAAVIADSVRLYEAESLRELCTLVPPERITTTGLAMSADGTYLVQMSNRAGIGYIWDLHQIRLRLSSVGLDWGRRTPQP